METLEKILQLVVAPTAIVGAITYLLRKYLDRSFEKSLENFKSDISQRQFAFETKFSALHQERAKAISELYGLLYQAETAIEDLVSPLQSPAGPPISEKKKATFDAFYSLRDFYSAHRIYFPSTVCGLMDKSIRVLGESIAEFQTAHIHGMDAKETYEVDRTGQWIEAWKNLKDNWHPLKLELESSFRQLLGDERDGAA
jgi:hypothetical protein